MSDIQSKCEYCPAILLGFKELVIHYRCRHPKLLKRYLVKNKPLKQSALAYCAKPEEICQMFEWDIKDCTVTEI